MLACRADQFDRVDRALIAEKLAADELERASVIDDRPCPWLAVWQARMRAVTVLSRMLKVNPAARQTTPASDPEPIHRPRKADEALGIRQALRAPHSPAA